MLMIGTVAQNLVVGSEYKRQPNDVDILAYKESIDVFLERKKDDIKATKVIGKSIVVQVNNGALIEFTVADKGTSNDDILKLSGARASADINTLLMLKLSHRYLRNSPHFYKTMRDIRLLREHGAVLTPVLKKILRKREKETYVYAHPSIVYFFI